MIVVDTNVIVYLFVSGESTALAEKLYQRDPDWHAPYLWRSEFRNTLAGHWRARNLSRDAILKLVSGAEKFLEQKEYFVDSADVMVLVENSNCTAYDCEFIALAQKLGVPLITMDKKIIKEFPFIAQNLMDFVE